MKLIQLIPIGMLLLPSFFMEVRSNPAQVCYDQNGNVYQLGDIVPQSSPEYRCYTCTCQVDGINCIKECPAFICYGKIVEPVGDECCSRCEPGCVHNEILYKINQTIPYDACSTCTCHEQGRIQCASNPCPQISCAEELRHREDGECCDICLPGCVYKNNVYAVGATVPEHCWNCTCQADGAVKCTSVPCEPLQCAQELIYQEEGDCCPKCRDLDGCFYNGQSYPVGEGFPYGCYDCKCIGDGRFSCTKHCPPIYCAEELRYKNNGDCCESCYPGCVYNGKIYEVGEILEVECGNCQCQNDGQFNCSHVPCPQIQCAQSLMYKEDGDCCYSCRPGCDYYGEIYGVGDEFQDGCYDCTCQEDGSVSCWKQCPRLFCTQQLVRQNEGDCCKSCAGCVYGGVTYAVGEIMKYDECHDCKCLDNGQFNCTAEECPTIHCAEALLGRRSGECCYYCKDGCAYNGIAYDIGSPVPVDCYSSCNCTDTGIHCTGISCPGLPCPEENWEYVDGACCPTCKP